MANGVDPDLKQPGFEKAGPLLFSLQIVLQPANPVREISMSQQLNDMEIRILGSLMEKSLATPDIYPLSLNALVNASNQKSSRDPVVDYAEADVEAVLEQLIVKDLVQQSHLGRVVKFEERLTAKYNFVPQETALLSVLLLRGPQTLGELRNRTARLHHFETLEAVLQTLETLEDAKLVQRLPRQSGHKEFRYTHLLGSPPETSQPASAVPQPASAGGIEARLAQLEQTVASLGHEVAGLKQAFNTFKKQFE
jgi:hypothetical protein